MEVHNIPGRCLMQTLKRLLLLNVLCCCLVEMPVRLAAQEPSVMNASELRLALQKLTVLGSVLYITAHPDDENTAFLASMSKGRFVRAGNLSITRGDGGQNLIGSEQSEQLGVIRTQELLAARRIDGAEQYFTRAIDFGYSKTSDETMRIWGKEKILADVVWVIRSFRPDVIVTRFTPTQGGHGNHTASAILAQEAFDAAADPNRFPEQLKSVKPWKARRLVWNVFRFQQSDNPVKPPNSISLDLGKYNPLLGKSFTEIAGQSRSMHKSQGFGAGQNRGEFLNYFQHVLGEPALENLFDGVNLTWSRVAGSESVSGLLEEAAREFDDEHPSKILTTLIKAFGEMSKLSADPWVNVKKKELLEVIKSCAGMWIDALASESSSVPGGEVRIVSTVLNRSDYPFILERVRPTLGDVDSIKNILLVKNIPVRTFIDVKLPVDLEYSQPFWLRISPGVGSYEIDDQQLIGAAEGPAPLTVKVSLSCPDGPFEVETPVRYRFVHPVDGEQYRPFEVVPPITVNLRENVLVFAGSEEKKVTLVLRSGTPAISGRARLDVPAGWIVRPEFVPLTFTGKNQEQTATFVVKPSTRSRSGTFKAEVEVGGASISVGMTTIQYPHIPLQTLFPPAEGKLVQVDLRGKPLNIGYIMGPGDEIPAALRQIGYPVTLLSDEDLANADLSSYEVIISGVRAYNTRDQLRKHQQRLMEYVYGGGTYVVQYVTQQRGESENLGPYPFDVSRDRVSVEDAPVAFLDPNHRLLNSPNKITQEDFEGWIQERGLYFAGKWDPKYETVISSNDPGETPKPGGLLVAKHGKGYYIYTGYAWFRQLPAGVPGAYRLFVNMVSIGK